MARIIAKESQAAQVQAVGMLSSSGETDVHFAGDTASRSLGLVPETLAIGNFTTPPEYPRNNGSVVFEVFKVQDGLIRQIEAFFRGNGQLHSGWGSGPGS